MQVRQDSMPKTHQSSTRQRGESWPAQVPLATSQRYLAEWPKYKLWLASKRNQFDNATTRSVHCWEKTTNWKPKQGNKIATGSHS